MQSSLQRNCSNAILQCIFKLPHNDVTAIILPLAHLHCTRVWVVKMGSFVPRSLVSKTTPSPQDEGVACETTMGATELELEVVLFSEVKVKVLFSEGSRYSNSF